VFAGIGDLGGRDQPRQSAADHDYVCVLSHRVLPRSPLIQDRAIGRGQRQMALACGCAATFGTPTCFSLGFFGQRVQRASNTQFELLLNGLRLLDKITISKDLVVSLASPRQSDSVSTFSTGAGT
jgi:hypothetical protein